MVKLRQASNHGGGPNRIVIETEYTDSVDLPLFKHGFVLRPFAEKPL